MRTRPSSESYFCQAPEVRFKALCLAESEADFRIVHRGPRSLRCSGAAACSVSRGVFEIREMLNEAFGVLFPSLPLATERGRLVTLL